MTQNGFFRIALLVWFAALAPGARAAAHSQSLSATDLPANVNSERVFMGPFFSIQVVGDDLHALSYLKNFTYTVVIDGDDSKFQSPGLYGDTTEQKRLVFDFDPGSRMARRLSSMWVN